MLAFFFPQQAAFFNAKAEEAGHSRLLAGVQYPSDVQAAWSWARGGSARHRARAERQLGRGLHWDDPTRRLQLERNNPIPPDGRDLEDLDASSGSQIRPGPPPACDSAQMAQSLPR